MITVTATDLLKTIDATLVQYVEPSLGDIGGKSALATVRHLLNFVKVRIEREGQVLLDDIAALKLTLADVIAYHRAAGDDAGATEQALNAAPAPDPTKYRSLNDLSAEAATLRETLYRALARLQALRAARGDDPRYKALRAAIRAYIVRQIEQEGEIVAPAFFGRGPRR
jgi:hypothetical protein